MALLGQVLSLHRLLQLYNPELAPPVSRTTHSSINILRSRYLIHIFNVAVFPCRCVSSGTLAFWSLQNIQFYLWENCWFYRLDRQGLSNCALDSFWRYRLFGKNTAKTPRRLGFFFYFFISFFRNLMLKNQMGITLGDLINFMRSYHHWL